MVNHKAPVDSCAKSGEAKKFISSKSVPEKKSESQVWRMATWSVHGGLSNSDYMSKIVVSDIFFL